MALNKHRWCQLCAAFLLDFSMACERNAGYTAAHPDPGSGSGTGREWEISKRPSKRDPRLRLYEVLIHAALQCGRMIEGVA
jgi:hypothetical protein